MKKELIEKIMSLTHPTQDIAYVGKGFLQQILEEELPDFQRIDEERMGIMWKEKYDSIHWNKSETKLFVDKYNSTLPTALVPLPKEKPKWFHNGISYHDLWSMVCLNYGTPANNLQPLPDDHWITAPKEEVKEFLANNIDKKEYDDKKALLLDKIGDLRRKELEDKYIEEHCGNYTEKEKIVSRNAFQVGWNIRNRYGTPAKPSLPSVEELAKEIEELKNEIMKLKRFNSTKKILGGKPKIQMLTACGMFEINPMFTSATLCKNCGKEKALHVTPPKN